MVLFAKNKKFENSLHAVSLGPPLWFYKTLRKVFFVREVNENFNDSQIGLFIVESL